MTTPKRNEAGAWQERHRNRDGTWGAWSPCSKAYVDTFLSDPDGTYETRELVPASELAALQGEVSRLRAIIDTPQSNDFLRAVSTEAEHQRQRWGSEHDAGKTPADWFWLVGYLAGKALHAHAAGNVEKAEHHIITTAAALANWHLSMFGGTDMRPGIDGEAALNLEPPTDGQ